MNNTINPKVANRIRIEKSIARAVVKAAHALGFTFEIDNGGDGDEWVKTSGIEPTLKEMFATDDERLYILKDGKPFGWVYFVYGNDGWDVINNYTTNLEPLKIVGEGSEADKISERHQR